jgi:hypothetical protein
MAGTHAPPQPMNPRRVDSVIADVFNFADVASLQNFMQSFAFLFAAGDRSRKYVRLAALHDHSGVPRSRARQFPVSRIYRGGSRVTGVPRTQSRNPNAPFADVSRGTARRDIVHVFGICGVQLGAVHRPLTGVPRTRSRQFQPKCPFRGIIAGDRASRYCSCAVYSLGQCTGDHSFAAPPTKATKSAVGGGINEGLNYSVNVCRCTMVTKSMRQIYISDPT